MAKIWILRFIRRTLLIYIIFSHRIIASKQGYPKEKWNSIINKTPITYSTNREIGGVSPSAYIKKIEDKNQVHPDNLDIYLSSHLISTEDIRSDNFDSYFIKRAAKILDLIGSATGKPITNRNSDEIITEFG